METFFIVVLIAIVLIRWVVLSNRISELRRRIDELESRPSEARLIQRIFALEQAVEKLRREEAAGPPPLPEPESVVAPSWQAESPAPPAAETERLAPPVAAAAGALREEEAAASWHVETPAMPAAEAPASSLGERVRQKMSGEEWEAIVGGSWLNKLGVFVLVIGIALFLGYSFTKMGPPGRVAVGMAVSFAMLGGGVFLERRARYAIFARGLLGGGWAALYFTTYAMFAVEAARVIDNVWAGSLLLLMVATGMIGHS